MKVKRIISMFMVGVMALGVLSGWGSAADESGNTLVVYFSATGNTEAVANTIAETTGGDLFELVPVEPYTDEDLDWTDRNSRVSVEHENEDGRNVELVADTVDNWESYDTVFIGYPIWWGIAAWPVDTFVRANDFTGKMVIPFATSSSSGLGESGELLAEMAATGEWLDGERFRSGVSEEDVQDWVDGIKAEVSSRESSSESAQTMSVQNSDSNILIAYFSIPEDIDISSIDADSGASVVVREGEAVGNMQFMAEAIQQAVGGDLFRIETVESYPLDHEPLVDQAADEQEENARPALSTQIENLEQYDTIFVGYPNWWGDMPQPMYTFFEEYDFSGKTIIPFNSHGGSRFSNTISTIADMQPNAIVTENGLTISRNDVANSREEVMEWAQEMVDGE